MQISQFIIDQLAEWPMAAKNFSDLATVKSKQAGWARVQFNPARIVSTGAKMDKTTLAKRPCFLCAANRPEQQMKIEWGNYEILVNPFPIFPHHLTIPALGHMPQSIIGRVADMCRLAKELPGYVVFYNGPRCGASAPDHMHFQAGDAELLPILKGDAPFGVIRLCKPTPERMEAAFANVYSMLPKATGEEAMMNVLCTFEAEEYRLIIIPRRRHRPSFYGSEPGQMLISPASVDLGGLLITPRQEDFDQITEADMQRVFNEVCYSQSEVDAMLNPPSGRTISVGIITAPRLEISFHGEYEMITGDEPAVKAPENIAINAADASGEILFRSLSPDARAEVKDVVIGVNFHWERKENQQFVGDLRILPTAEGLTLINVLPVERYLASVISSEMSATSQSELLKAHAVISRSWVMAQILNKYMRAPHPISPISPISSTEIVKWYDHDDHTLFDVCADDHCQRYQGVTRQTTEAVEQAIADTEGLVLVYDGQICDARFSKCCGGAFETFENCWEPTPKPYLQGLADTVPDRSLPDLTIEGNARKWIMSSPKAFCNTQDAEVLRQVLNGYDRETADFYRWKVDYDADELGRLIYRKSGYDFGRILALEPLQRGTSGRIVRLRIVGEKLTLIIGKELEIRRWLSPSHLYSSAFVPEKNADGSFTLHGAGWGHGVGLCQIGAAMMAAKGYTAHQILLHYFPGAKIMKL